MEVKSKKLVYLKRYANKLKKSIKDQNSEEKLQLSYSSQTSSKFKFKHHQLNKKSKLKTSFFSSKIKKSHLIHPLEVNKIFSNSFEHSRCSIVKRPTLTIKNQKKVKKSQFCLTPKTTEYVSFIKCQELRPRSVSPIESIKKETYSASTPKRVRSIKVQILNPELDED
jgi:hypothetical protein